MIYGYTIFRGARADRSTKLLFHYRSLCVAEQRVRSTNDLPEMIVTDTTTDGRIVQWGRRTTTHEKRKRE